MRFNLYRALLPLALVLVTACGSPAAPVAEQPTASAAPPTTPSPAPSASPSSAPPTLVPATASPSAAPSVAPSPSAAPSIAPSATAAPGASASAPPEILDVAILELGGQLRLVGDGPQLDIADMDGDDFTDSDLVWSPDGWRLATRDGIRTFGADGSRPIFTPLGGNRYRWSPDSRYLAWTLPIEEHTDALIVAGPDGDQPQNLDGSHWGLVGLPDWRPDGAVVIAGTLAATPAGSSTLPALPEERGPDATWSPDGGALAWSEIVDDGLMITRTLTLWDGTATTTLGAIKVARGEADIQFNWTTAGYDPPRLFWMTDGSGVLVSIPRQGLRDGGGTWLVGRDRTVTRISEAVLSDLAPDGQRMLARTADNQIVVVRVADGTIERELGPGIAAAWRPTPVGAPPSAPLAEKSPTLSLQSPRAQGEPVREVQQRLLKLGYDVGYTDAIFGPQTEQAVREFQEQQGLGVDGIVGPKTWATLRALEWSPLPIE